MQGLQLVGPAARACSSPHEEKQPWGCRSPSCTALFKTRRAGSIEFDRVYFQYPGSGPVLCGVSFVVPAGATVAFVVRAGLFLFFLGFKVF